jgi:hypothetical protein
MNQVMNQHEAVIAATKEILGSRFEAGMDVKDIASKDDKQAVVAVVVRMFQAGTASMSDEAKTKYSDAKALTGYTAGLVTNWWNKSKTLNGGEKYEAKNPGARAGSNDEQIKELKNLKAHLEAVGNVEGVAKVAEAITQRIAELRAESSAKKLPEVDMTKIPEHLRGLIGEDE